MKPGVIHHEEKGVSVFEETGMSVDQLREVGRIAAVIAVAANASAVDEAVVA